MGTRGESERAFARCVGVLQRGVVSGGDVSEVFESFVDATGCVGLWFSVAGPVAAEGEVISDVDPSWQDAYIPHASEDPCLPFLAANGPFAVFSGATHAPDTTWKTPLGQAFRRAGWVDVAVLRIPSARDGLIAAYRPLGLAPFSACTLARMSALLPLLDLAFAPSVALEAITRSRSETHEAALARIGAYAILGSVEGDVEFSPGALRLFARVFDGIGAHGRSRIERAIRRGYARLRAQKGTRVIALRSDLTAELSLLPRRGHAARIFAAFSHRPAARDTSLRPCDELLSPTQRVVARRITEGATVPALARALGVSADAVKAHLREVYRRLGVESRAELAELYAR